MKQVAIVIDNWKLSIFHKHLTDAGFTYTEGDGLTQTTRSLYIKTNKVLLLGDVAKAANAEAASKITPQAPKLQ